MTRVPGIALAVVASGVVMRGAQTPPQTAAPKTFEVASIKQNRSGDKAFSWGARPGGRWVMTNTVISVMIREAFPTESNEIVGAPSWVGAQPYDVVAKGEGNPTREELRQMMRALLADRFKLSVHEETQERPVFALVPARTDGRLGPAIHPFDVDCSAVAEARRMGRRPDTAPPANGAPLCGYTGSGWSMKFGGVPMSRLAEFLRGPVERFVVDKTGLAGNYEFTLEYSLPQNPDASLQARPADPTPLIFTAVQEQLGLKLVPDRAPLRVLVVDRIERPTED